jgi:hypothetical protein
VTRNRTPIYRDDIASVPSDWAEVSSQDWGDAWVRDQVAVRKSDQVFLVSSEFIEDYGVEGVFGLLRPQSWAERAEQLRYESSIRVRLSRAWRSTRYRFARWVADDFVGPDGWEL